MVACILFGLRFNTKIRIMAQRCLRGIVPLGIRIYQDIDMCLFRRRT